MNLIKIISICVLLNACPMALFSQSSYYTVLAKQCNPNLIFSRVEQMPKIEDGAEKLEFALNKRINLKKNKKGSIIYKFTINCKGEVVNIKTIANQLGEDATQILDYIRKHIIWSSPKHKNEAVDCNKILNIEIVAGHIFLIED